MTRLYVRDPRGRVRRIVCYRMPECSRAFVRVGLFRKIEQHAAPGADVVGNLVCRLEKDGWQVVE